MIVERGISLDELGQTSIPEVMEERVWTRYVKQPSLANYALTREFYANMVQQQFTAHKVVMVRGVPVVIS